MKELIKCNICQWNMSHFLSWKDYRQKSNDKLYDVYKCNSCLLEKIEPTPSKVEQSSFYSKIYYSYNLTKKKSILQKIIDYIYNKFENIKYDYKFFESNLGKNYLDIWCGDGVTLEHMNQKWRNSYWYEFSTDTKKENNIFYSDGLQNTNFWIKFDLIYMRHAFEHVDEPNEYLKKINLLLNKNWRFILILPNTECLSSKLFWKYAPERDIPRHLYNYNKSNLLKLLKENWFDIIESTNLQNYWSVLWLQRMLEDKFWFTIKWLFRFLLIPTIIFDILMTITKNTNQIWFILKKNNDK